MSNIKIFNHEQFGELNIIIEKDGIIYFDGNQVAKMLGYKEPNKAVSRHCKGGMKHSTLKNRGGYPLTIISKEDVISLVTNSNLLTQLEKEEFLVALGLDDRIVLQSRAEIEFGEQLTLFMSQLGYKVEPQYGVLGYYIDFYIPELNIAIEYDEEQHKYNYKKDRQRELEIRKEIGCKFIRLDDGLNIGTQLGIVANGIYTGF